MEKEENANTSGWRARRAKHFITKPSRAENVIKV